MKRFLFSGFPVVALLVLTLSACQTSAQERIAREQLDIYLGGGSFEKAKEALRLDDFRDFDNAEMHLLTLRLGQRENVEIGGWLAQLYVAWAEQLRSEIWMLQVKLAAARAGGEQKDRQAVFSLIDYRISQLEEVEEGAQGMCNLLVTYNPDNYIGHRVLADYYRLMGDEKMMRREMEEVRRLNPQSVGLKFLEGAAKAYFEHDYQGAILHYEQSLEKDEKFVKALYFKGLAEHFLGQSESARLTMERVLGESVGHPGARGYLSMEKYLSDLTEEARGNLIPTGSDPVYSEGGPRLILWAGETSGSRPGINCRIKGASAFITEHKLLATLVTAGVTRVLAQRETIFNLKENEYSSIHLDFEFEKDTDLGGLEILLHHQVRPPGAEDYQTVDIRRTPVP